MKFSRKLIVLSAFFMFSIAIAVFVNMGYANTLACNAGIETAAGCGRCGDGYCNPRCGENKFTCPKDCAGVPSRK